MLASSLATREVIEVPTDGRCIWCTHTAHYVDNMGRPICHGHRFPRRSGQTLEGVTVGDARTAPTVWAVQQQLLGLMVGGSVLGLGALVGMVAI